MLPDDHADAITLTLTETQAPALRQRWAYYAGRHPKVYVTPKVREMFRRIADSLMENYCGMAVNARTARLAVESWDGPGAVAAEQVWTDGGFPQRQDVLYRWGLVHGAAYLIVADDVLTANPATVAYAEPDPDDWLGVAWGGKAWLDGDDWHVTLWDETTIYRYVAPHSGAKKSRRIPGGDQFIPDPDDPTSPHGYPRVPVFPVNPFGYMASPLMDQISPIQDRVNKIVANKFVAAEFGAFKQRVFFTRQTLDPYAVRQQPDHAIVLDPGDETGRASVQELGATDLANYDAAKNAEVDALFTIAALPRHMRVNPGADASGEAIKADEGPFTESLVDHQREFGEALTAALAVMGIDATPVWRDVVVQNDVANAQIVKTLVDAGVPWQVAVQKYLGMSPNEIAEATMMKANEQSQAMTQMAAQTAALLSNPTLPAAPATTGQRPPAGGEIPGQTAIPVP